MYKKIMVPVDLSHTRALAGALSVAGMMAETCGAELIFAGVHRTDPAAPGESKAAYADRLTSFAKGQPAAQTVAVSSLAITDANPFDNVAPILIAAASEHQIDLIVMASHVPGWAEHIFHSNAGYVASHAPISVFVVR